MRGVLLAVGLWAARASWAETSSQAPEPIAADEVTPTAPGEWEARAQVTAQAHEAVGTGILFVGLANRLGAEISVPLGTYDLAEATRTGTGSFESHLEYIAFKRGRFALGAGVGVRLGAEQEDLMPESSRLGLEGSLGVATSIGDVGIQLTCGASTESLLTTSISVARAFPLRLDLLAEAISETDLKTRLYQAVAGPGVRFHVTDELFVAAAVLGALNPQSATRAIVQVQHAF